MGEVGVLHEDNRIERIDGELVSMAGIRVAHADTLATLTEFVALLVSRVAWIRVQNPNRGGRLCACS